MAEKRMFTQKIIDSDAFLEMPLSAQALYFHLNMRADDDGFVNNPKRVTKLVSASDDDLKILLLKRFIIGFESGVIVIKHWRMHNTLRMDRYHPTDYQDEFRQLGIKDNKAYTDHPENLLPSSGSSLAPEWKPDGNQMEPENREGLGLGLGKDKGLSDNYKSSDNTNASNKPEDLTNADAFVCRTKDVRRVMEAWNSLGLSQIQKILPDTNRGVMLRKRILDYGVDAVCDAIEKVRGSTFLMGGNKKGWTITFDWFIKPNNFPKVMEGNYDDHGEVKSGAKIKTPYDGLRSEAHGDDLDRLSRMLNTEKEG